MPDPATGAAAGVGGAPASAESHISWVLLSGALAYKLYKPLVTDVLDHRTVERRRAACEREVALNRRIAPDVYLGLGSLVLDGDELEPVVVMRRMPDDRRLTSLLDDAGAVDHVRAVARKVASFHESCGVLSPADAAEVASAEALQARWEADIDGLRALWDGDDDLVEWIRQAAADYLRGRGALVEHRIETGMIRDGHGDIQADDIFCLDDGPRILDCLAFDDHLRWGDVLSDVGFLVMDLHRLGHPALARSLLSAYCEFSGEHHPGSLAHLHVAQRALVRAKVAALRSTQAGTDDTTTRQLLDLVVDHLRRAEIHVVLVGGLPGSGKSTVAGALSEEVGWAVLSSDEIRRDLGLRYEDLGDDSAYDSSTVAAVYEELRRQAATLVANGVSVILDATWTSDVERAAARAMARAGHATTLEIRCVAPEALCRARVARRSQASLSEATTDVVDVLAGRADPWPESVDVATEGDHPPPAARVRAWWTHGS